jgi:thiol-disulfide isomerase/thioredoxin
MRQFKKMLLLVTVAVAALAATDVSSAVDTPKDRTVAMYFHRTERCPTCKKMGAYSEETVKEAFADQLKDGTVEFHMIDFQDPKNARLAKGYKVEGPALIVAKIVDNRVVEYKDLEGIWDRVTDKAKFSEYVEENIAAYQKK